MAANYACACAYLRYNHIWRVSVHRNAFLGSTHSNVVDSAKHFFFGCPNYTMCCRDRECRTYGCPNYTMCCRVQHQKGRGPCTRHGLISRAQNIGPQSYTHTHQLPSLPLSATISFFGQKRHVHIQKSPTHWLVVVVSLAVVPPSGDTTVPSVSAVAPLSLCRSLSIVASLFLLNVTSVSAFASLSVSNGTSLSACVGGCIYVSDSVSVFLCVCPCNRCQCQTSVGVSACDFGVGLSLLFPLSHVPSHVFECSC